MAYAAGLQGHGQRAEHELPHPFYDIL